MRILLIASNQSTHSAKWGNSLVNRGHEIIFVSYPAPDRPSIRFDNRIIRHKLKFGGKLGYYLNVFEIRSLYKKYKPDVVAVHYASGFGTMARLAGLRPLVISCYGSDVFTYPYLNKFNMYNIRKNLSYADAVGCTSEIMAIQTRKVMNNPNMKITVTPFGVDMTKFHPRGIKIVRDRPVIGIIKYLEPIYDIPLLIHAFAIIYNEMLKKPLLKIYGNGYLKDELVRLTQDLGLEEGVSFMGAIPNTDVPEALGEMDIFVNSSKNESFGVNMVEAMACQIPIVATDTPGAREVVEDGVSGFIMKDRNPETMAEHFRQLLNDDTLRKKMGKAGYERACSLYDWDKNLTTIEQLLSSVVNS